MSSGASGESSRPSALAFAARHPDRVSALVVWEGTACLARYEEETPFVAARAVADRDFHQFIEMGLPLWWGTHVSPEDHVRFVALAEASFNRGRWTAYGVAARRLLDATEELASIQCPTLVVHRRGFRLFGDRLAREMAVGISGSQLVALDGDSLYPFIGDREEALSRVQGFLDEHLAESGAPITQGVRSIFSPQPPSDRAALTHADRPAGLTPRELEVLRLLATGRNNREIAEDLSIARPTAARHVSNLLRKIECDNRVRAAQYALRHGIIE